MTMFNVAPKGSTLVVDTNFNSHCIPSGYSIRVMAAGSYITEEELTSALSRDLGLQLRPVYVGAWNCVRV